MNPSRLPPFSRFGRARVLLRGVLDKTSLPKRLTVVPHSGIHCYIPFKLYFLCRDTRLLVTSPCPHFLNRNATCQGHLPHFRFHHPLLLRRGGQPQRNMYSGSVLARPRGRGVREPMLNGRGLLHWMQVCHRHTGIHPSLHHLLNNSLEISQMCIVRGDLPRCGMRCTDDDDCAPGFKCNPAIQVRIYV